MGHFGDRKRFIFRGQELKKLGSGSEKGIALVLALLLLLVATLIGINAVNTTTFEANISGNKRASEQAFYSAEAGINEFFGRFRDGAVSEIAYYDASCGDGSCDQNKPGWRFYIALNSTKAGTKGYNSGDPTNHRFYTSLQNTLDYVVEARHKIDPSTGQVIKFPAPSGEPIYVVKSYGFTGDGGNKVIEVEVRKRPSYDPPSALYSEAPVTVSGNATIQGNDQCGGTNPIDKPAIIKTNLSASFTVNGKPQICGSNGCPEEDPGSYVPASNPQLNLSEMISYLKEDLDYSYTYTDNQTLTGTGPSNSSYPWGVPTGEVPLTYTGTMKIVHVKMTGAANHNTLTLSGTSSGAGVLLVEGNLDLSGNFSWYGVIIATGGVKFSGGGSNKNITGGLLTGTGVNDETDVTGSARIFYCSQVKDKIKDRVSLFRTLRWGEVY